MKFYKREISMIALPTASVREEIHKRIAPCENIDYQKIGCSILGKPIYCYRVGRGKTNVLYVAAHHGSEYLTAIHLYDFLLRIADGETRLTSEVMEKCSLFVVPCLNPDGVDISISGIEESPIAPRLRAMIGEGNSEKWKANARGVDLNHNYPFGFSEYKKIEHERGIVAGATLYSGEYPVSEPETRALMRLVLSLDFALVLSLHSAGEEIYPGPKGECTEFLAGFISDSLGYKISAPTDTALYGGLCDYTAGELGIPSVTLEIGRGENPLPLSEFYREREKIHTLLHRLPEYLLGQM